MWWPTCSHRSAQSICPPQGTPAWLALLLFWEHSKLFPPEDFILAVPSAQNAIPFIKPALPSHSFPSHVLPPRSPLTSHSQFAPVSILSPCFSFITALISEWHFLVYYLFLHLFHSLPVPDTHLAHSGLLITMGLIILLKMTSMAAPVA